jgi:hypothetical protein
MQASPYSQATPARVSKNRNPPLRSLSSSVSIVSEPVVAGVFPDRTNAPGDHGPRLRTTNRRVRFIPEVEDEQVVDPQDDTNRIVRFTPAVEDERVVGPKDGTTSGALAAPDSSPHTVSVTQTTRVQRTDRGSSSGRSDTNLERKNPVTPRPAPAQRLRLQGDIGVAEDTLSDEGDTPADYNPGPSQTYNRPRRDVSVRSAIRDLLDANKEAPVVDTNTAIVLESLLSKMSRGGSERLALYLPFFQLNDSIFRSFTNPGPAVGLSLHTRTEATFVGRLNGYVHLTDNTT